MSEQNILSLFTAADGACEAFLSHDAFEQSLVMNILFQNGLLIQDTSIFTSKHLAMHIRNSMTEESLFELATEEGFVHPAFRHAGTSSMRDAQDAIEQDLPSGAIKYDDPDVKKAVPRIIAAIDKGIEKGNARPVYWPKKHEYSLGEHYHSLLNQILQEPEVPGHLDLNSDRGHNILIGWKDTERWRREYISKAARRTVENGGMGLQRTHLYYLLGEEFDVPNKDATTNNLIAAAKSHSPALGLAMIQFITWLAQCHYLNQARALGVASNFPFYDRNRDFILDSILEVPASSSVQTVQCEVELPPISALAREEPGIILAMRKELGNAYLGALGHWARSPSSRNMEYVINALQEYCERISVRYSRAVRKRYLFESQKGDSVVRAAFSNAPDDVVRFVGKPFVSVGRYVLTRIVRVLAKKKMQALRPNKTEIEVSLSPEVAGCIGS